MKLLIHSLVLLLVCVQPVLAQQGTRPTGPEVMLHFGIYHGGSGRSIARQFEDGGFGEEGTSSGFFGTEENPERSEGSVQLGVLFPVRQNFRAKGLLQYRDNEVEGNAIFFEPLQHHMIVLTAAALGYLPMPFRHFRLGAGPAFHLARGTVDYGGAEQAKKNAGKLGFVLEGAFSIPGNRRLYADLQAQYMYVGRTDLGRHTFTVDITDSSTETKTADFSSTKLSTFVLSLGIGYKLYKL